MTCVVSAPGRVRIGVEDTGEGLSPADMAQLFQPFNRLGREATVEEGTGIGLVVCKRLVELMGGVIGVDSTVGTGSAFWIELNLTTSPQPSDIASTTVPSPMLAHVGPVPSSRHPIGKPDVWPEQMNFTEAVHRRRSLRNFVTIELAREGVDGLLTINALRASTAVFGFLASAP